MPQGHIIAYHCFPCSGCHKANISAYNWFLCCSITSGGKCAILIGADCCTLIIAAATGGGGCGGDGAAAAAVAADGL